MIGRQRGGVFLSYARKDGEHFAANLRERLRDKAPDIEVKQDRVLLEGGVGWWKQLTEAIDSVEFLILVMTPSTMQSETVQKEWRYARQAGVCVYPVKGAPDADLQFSNLPRWMSKAHFYDIDREWESLVAHLRKGCDAPRVPFMAPDLPENFVERPEEFGQLKNLLLSNDRREPVAITTALSGAGGFGKTTLAIALCHDEDIVQNFDDGILWVTLGQNPNVMSALVTAYAALTGERPGFANEEDAAFQLGQKFEDHTCLLVIDDVWDESHLRPFLRSGKGGARLFTTRHSEIASKARPVKVDEMSGTQSQALLAKGVPGLSSVQARLLSQRLGEWPIALELASAMMRQRIEQGDSPEHAAQRLLYTLDRKGARGLVKGTGGHRTLDSVLQGSLELLSDEDRARLIELSIFPEDVPFPLTAAALLWGLDEFESEEAAQRFARLYMLKLDLVRGSMRLHDVMRSWLASATTNGAELHSRLADGWTDWYRLPNTYAWRWLTLHLAHAGRKAEIEKLLWDPLWLRAKLSATDVNALVSDFEHLKPSAEAELTQGALRLSSHVLAKDPTQFVSQMVGRLLPYSEQQPIVQRFIDSLTQAVDHPWLRQLRPSLDPPGTALLRTLAGHSGGVYGVAVSIDGRRALSASSDRTLKIWDLETGQELCTLAGHSDAVIGLTVSPNGQTAGSASRDRTLKVWDIKMGQELHTLVGHSNSVNGVAISQDGRRAVSASDDKTLKVWDLETGLEMRVLVGHSDPVNGVALSPNGWCAVSASWDKTLKVWDLDAGEELRTLVGHSKSVAGVAVNPDGRRAVSASNDHSLKVWDLETGKELRTLVGHSGCVTSVAVSPDGLRAVSASYDYNLKVWDLESGKELRTLAGHSDWVNGIAISPDGLRAVSASSDHTLKVWDLETHQGLRTLAVHFDSVTGVAVSLDRHRAISASADNTLKTWDLETGQELSTLIGHSSRVTAVVVSPDGQRAVSASFDTTLKVWDLETGRELRTLAGHAERITSVAMSPDGLRAVSASDDRTLRVWDLETGKELCKLWGHSRPVTGVAVTPDGREVISASGDRTLKIWNLETGRERCTLGYLSGWDTETGQEVRRFAGHSDSVTDVAVSPDGRLAVSASDDHTLKVWGLGTGQELRTLAGHSGPVTGVAISPDRRRAVSASDDHTLRVWDLETGVHIATFTCDSDASCCALADERTIVAGDGGGRVYFLALELPQRGSVEARGISPRTRTDPKASPNG